MGRKNIYEKDPFYSMLKPVVDWNIRQSYRMIEVQGRENIPSDGAVILAPNHCNTLMDALVMLRANSKITVFGARADMFNRPLIANIMYFLKILPMVRQRDGLRNVLKNHETNEIIVSTLEYGSYFCIYPEGRHRPAHSLLPLGKGVFRAALAANGRFGDRKPVYIVPVGIEYGDYFRFRSTSLITFGKAIDVTEFAKSCVSENEAQMMEPLRKELSARMSELITYIKDDEDYAGKWALVKMLTLGSAGRLSARLSRNRKVIEGIEEARTAHPEQMKSLLDKAADFDRLRRKAGISIFAFREGNMFLRILLKAIAALVALPYYIYSALASLPMWTVETFIRGRVKDKAFRNTVSFGIKLGLGIIMGIVWAVLAFCLIPSPWCALATYLLTLPAYNCFHDYNEFMRRFVSDIRLLGNGSLRTLFKEITNEYRNLK